jgi:hypothetical protein
MCAGLQVQQAKMAALGKQSPDPAMSGGGAAAGRGAVGRGRKEESPLEAAEPAVEHECPICMDNAEDEVVGGAQPGQCYACGQLFCGECRPR